MQKAFKENASSFESSFLIVRTLMVQGQQGKNRSNNKCGMLQPS